MQLRVLISSCSHCISSGWRLWPQSELPGSCIWFLRERVRDLRERVFLRELIAFGDLAGSCIVKILHCVKEET